VQSAEWGVFFVRRRMAGIEIDIVLLRSELCGLSGAWDVILGRLEQVT